MENITLKGEPRKDVGTRAARALRSAGQVPAVIYGHGRNPEAVSLSLHEVELALAHGARMLAVKVGRKAGQYLIKEVQYDYLNHVPIHLDLARVNLDERVRVRVGIELRGVPKGVSAGGILEQYMAGIEVECVVTEIPDTLRPLVTHLGIDESLLVKDLALAPGVVALAEPDERVAGVRVLAVAEPAVPVAAEAEEKEAEPEVIRKERKTEDEGE